MTKPDAWRYAYVAYSQDGREIDEGFVVADSEEDAIQRAKETVSPGEYIGINPIPVALFWRKKAKARG